MEYYGSPEGAERALRSRIRRCYVALDELHSAVEYLSDSTAHLNEDYAVTAANRMPEMYPEAVRNLTGMPGLDSVVDDVSLQRVQDRLLLLPLTAEDVCRPIQYIHEDAEVILRNIEYQLDAGHFGPTDDVYRTIREKAITVLGLTDLILDALDSGFIIDARTYKEEGH